MSLVVQSNDYWQSLLCILSLPFPFPILIPVPFPVLCFSSSPLSSDLTTTEERPKSWNWSFIPMGRLNTKSIVWQTLNNSVEYCVAKGTLYSVDPKTRDWGPGDRGPRFPDPNWHTFYVYIYSTCVSNRSIEMHYGKVDGTFFLAAFIPFHSVNEQHPLNLLNMHVTFDP